MTVAKPLVVAVSGVKNSGKTTLIEAMLPLLEESGLTVAVVKHDGHSFDADPPGTDTGRFMAAGAAGTAIFDGEKFKIVKKQPVTEDFLITQFPEADLILLEGFKHSSYAKIEVVREGVSQTPVSNPDGLLAVATDLPAARICGSLPPSVKQLDLNDISGICRFIRSFLEDPASEREP